MNETMEEKLAQSMFERGAEKCTDDKTRIAFCKAYLKKAGVDIEPRPYMPNNLSLRDLQNFGREETYTFTARETIGDYDMIMATNKTTLMHNVKANLANKLMHELVKNDMIYFEEMKNYAMDSVEVYAGVKAAKWDKK
jgi:hypothetical protein